MLERSEEAKKEYPEGTCLYKNLGLTYRCSRQKYKNYDYCFWHIDRDDKFNEEFASEFIDFNKYENLNKPNQLAVLFKEKIEDEIKAGNYFEGVCLRGLNFAHEEPDLSKANFRHADLRNVHFGYGTLKEADLRYANLQGAYLSDVNLKDTNLSDVQLYNVKFRNNEFSDVYGLRKESFAGTKWGFLLDHKIFESPNESITKDCLDTYRKLKKYFYDLGALDDASWAAYKEKVMHRKILKANIRPINRIIYNSIFLVNKNELGNVIKLSLGESLSNLFRYLFSLFSSIIFGYGEKPLRVLSVSSFVIFVYSVLYCFLGVPINNMGEILLDFKSALYFSIVTFTTLGYGDLSPVKEYRLLAGSEALLGVILIGLFLFTLARRAVGRS